MMTDRQTSSSMKAPSQYVGRGFNNLLLSVCEFGGGGGSLTWSVTTIVPPWFEMCPSHGDEVWEKPSGHFILKIVNIAQLATTGYVFQPADVGIDRTYDKRRHQHCLSVVHGCQPSLIELFRSPLLVPATLCRAMSRPHHLCVRFQ